VNLKAKLPFFPCKEITMKDTELYFYKEDMESHGETMLWKGIAIGFGSAITAFALLAAYIAYMLP
jgi:hypothetical protein